MKLLNCLRICWDKKRFPVIMLEYRFWEPDWKVKNFGWPSNVPAT